MATDDWYKYRENAVDDDGRTSDDNSAYQIHQEDDIKEYELPPSASTIASNEIIDATDTIATSTSDNSIDNSTSNIDWPHSVANNDINNNTGYNLVSTPSASTSAASSTQPKFDQNFFARLVAIPLVHDSISNANTIVKQHALGRFAGRTLSTLYSATQKYIPTSISKQNSRLYSHLERANALGNRSLDAFEEHFPILIDATGYDLKHAPHLIGYGICGRIGSAIHRFREPADAVSYDMSRRMSLVIDNIEAVLDQYFPRQEQDEASNNKKKNEHEDIEDDLIDPQDGQRLNVDGDDDDGEEQQDQLYLNRQLLRMYRIANSLSVRIAKRIAIQLNHTNQVNEEEEEEEEEEENVVAMIKLREWLFTQTQQMVEHLDAYKSQLPEPLQAHIIQPMVQMAQKEYEILRQELDRKDISHVARARNVLTLSQDRVVTPLLQQSVESMRNHVVSYRSMAQENRAQVMNELSTKMPFLANIATVSAAVANHHFNSSMMKKVTEQQIGKKKMNGVHPPTDSEDNIIHNSSNTLATTAEAC